MPIIAEFKDDFGKKATPFGAGAKCNFLIKNTGKSGRFEGV